MTICTATMIRMISPCRALTRFGGTLVRICRLTWLYSRIPKKSYFPDWEYISPSPTGTITASVVDKADKVYFFTDTISHAAYYKYINEVRERNVNFGYIHGVNVEKCIRGIWRENEQV